MRGITVGLVVAVALLLPTAARAQSRLLQPAHFPTGPAAPVAPVVTVAPVIIADEDDSMQTIQRATERLSERLRPIEQRLREDDRLRRAEAVVGLSAMALGALRGAPPLTFAGTHALRFALNKQLSTIRRRSGFVVEPSIGHRSIAVSVSRTFDD